MAIIISNKNVSPKYYGAMETSVNIGFGIGSIEKVLLKVGTDNQNINFGYDNTTGTGVVVAKGSIVSSKILDIQLTNEVKTEDTYVAPAITVKYIDTDNSVKETLLAISNKKDIDDIRTYVDLMDTSVLTKVSNDISTAKSELNTTILNVSAFAESEANKAYTNAKAEVLGTATVTGKEQTVGAVSDRVAKLEDLIGENADDADNVINKLYDVYNWFSEVEETKKGKELINSVASNTTSINVLNSSVADNTSAITTNTANIATNAANITQEIADRNTAITNAIESLDVDDTAVEGKYVSAVSEVDGKIIVTRTDLPANPVLTVTEELSDLTLIDAVPAQGTEGEADYVPATDAVVVTNGISTYTIKSDENEITEKIVAVKVETVKEIMNIIKTEMAKTAAAEKTIADHEQRLQWIELNKS